MIVDNKDRRSFRNQRSEVRDQRSGASDFRPLTSDRRLLTSDLRPLTSGFRRSAATLLEVLVAIFIMGIGLIALLVLFPLGALTMAQAIQRDRAAHAAISASAIANVKDVRRDLLVYNPTYFDLFRNPNRPAVPALNLPAEPAVPFAGLLDADLERKSYPLLIDPVGYRTAAGLPAQYSVGGLSSPTGPLMLRRTNASFINGDTDVYRWFTVQDDIIFDKAGNAQVTGAGPLIERDVRYSIAYLLQRPRTANPSVVDCSVIIYDSRPLGLSGNLDLAEFPYDSGPTTTKLNFNPSTNVVTVNYALMGVGAPPLRAGDWILDVSIVSDDRHAYFYRVAGITDTGASMEIEVQQSLRGFPATGFSGPSIAYPNDRARLLFLEGVAEVFERGLGKNQ